MAPGLPLGSFGASMHSPKPILTPIFRSPIWQGNVACRQVILLGLSPHRPAPRRISGWSIGGSSERRSCCLAAVMSYRKSRLLAASRTKVTSPGSSCDPKGRAQVAGVGGTATISYRLPSWGGPAGQATPSPAARRTFLPAVSDFQRTNVCLSSSDTTLAAMADRLPHFDVAPQGSDREIALGGLMTHLAFVRAAGVT